MTNREEEILKWKNASTEDVIYQQDKEKTDEELSENFSGPLEFGTAGARATMGMGPAKINEFTAKAVAKAYAHFLKLQNKGKPIKIVIGHDNRHNAKLLTNAVGDVLNSEGIEVFIYENNQMEPTPFISFTIREMRLAGGVIITASHNPKEYNGIKVYDNKGGQLLPDDTKIIQEEMAKINPLEINVPKCEFSTVPATVKEEYVNRLLNIRIMPEVKMDLISTFTPQHGTSNVLGPLILEKIGVKNYNVESQMVEDPEFASTKSSNPEDAKSLDKAIKLARKMGADVAYTTDPDADRFSLVAKHKRRYKYFNGNQIAALYLDFMLNHSKKIDKKNSYIVTTVVSGRLAQMIAEKHGVEVKLTHVGFKNIADEIEKEKSKTFIFGYEESYGSLIDPTMCRDKDSFQSIVAVSEMVNYYKSQGKSLYQRMKELYEEYGLIRSAQISRKMSPKISKKLMNGILDLKEVNGDQVDYIEDYRNQSYHGLDKTTMVKVVLKSGTWFAIRPSGTEPKTKVYIQVIGKSGEDFGDIVFKEKQIENVIGDYSEIIEDKKFSSKKILKYAVLLVLFAAIMYFVIRIIYDSSGKNATENAMKYYHTSVFKGDKILLVYSSLIFTLIEDYLSRYILYKRVNVKLPFKHFFVAWLMSKTMAALTPLGIGGEGLEYWYLRKKGVPRGPLVSALFATTLLWQIQFVISSVFLFSFGYKTYFALLFQGSAESFAASMLFVIGLIWSVFATVMISVLSLSKKIQTFIITKSVKIIEWIPFITLEDPGKATSKYLYELKMMRKGFKDIITDPKSLIAIFVMKNLKLLIDFNAFYFAMNGAINEMPNGTYFSTIIANDIISTANSFAITPGGAGTAEWLSIVVRQYVYSGKLINEDFGSGADLQVAIDVLYKYIGGWPVLGASLVTIGNVIWGEQKLTKHNETNDGSKFMFYRYSLIAWAFIVIGGIVTLLLI